MKKIETNISERRFLERLETLCRKKERFDRGYCDKDIFVVKRNKNKFWICKHYANCGRTDGYAYDCMYCRYNVNEKGYVTVEYRLGKLRSALFAFVICFTVGIALWIPIVYEAVAFSNVQWGELCVTALFWIFGLVGMLFRSQKERLLLEEHLLRICNIKD